MYYSNLDLKNYTDNKKLWKTMKPFLTDKGVNSQKISLIENEKILSTDVDVAETLNSYFSEATKSQSINENSYILNKTINITDPIDVAVKKFESHPSILRMNENVYMTSFTFNTITLEEVEFEIWKMNPDKASASDSIPVRSFKENVDICGPVIHPIVNNAILGCTFPNKLKLADIAATHKKDNKTDKINYRPISMLPAVSKIFERIMQIQIASFIDKKLYSHMSEYRKGK